jgi:hypothetical protein
VRRLAGRTYHPEALPPWLAPAILPLALGPPAPES